MSDCVQGFGGEIGIQTLGRLAPSTVFETAAFDHSVTSRVRSPVFQVARYLVGNE